MMMQSHMLNHDHIPGARTGPSQVNRSQHK